MNIDEFYKDSQQKQERLINLKTEIQNDQKELKTLEQSYENALIAGDDTEADAIYPKLNQLKDKLKRNRFKLEKLESITDQDIKENAEKTIKHFAKVIESFEERARKIDDQMKPIQKEAKKLKDEESRLQEDIRDERLKYMRLSDDYGIKANKLGVSLNRSVEVFKETNVLLSGTPTFSRAPQTNDKKEDLPADATMEEIANANRVIGG